MMYRVITGILKARTAVHVGSGEGNELADLLLRRDTEGNILIPGTAIAGALRSMLTRLAPRLGSDVCVELLPPKKREERDEDEQKGCTCSICRLFGDVEPSDETPARGGEEKEGYSAASRLLVFNACLIDDGSAETLVRDGVGINRASGAAARATGAKFDMETLPAGAEFALRMELREPRYATEEEIEADQRLLAVALAEWKEGRAHLGGDVARGLGAFKLEEVEYKEHDLDDPDGLMTFLREPRPWEEAEDVEDWLKKRLDGAIQDTVEEDNLPADVAALPVTLGWAEWTFTLQAEGPFLTNDATSSGMSGFDHAPLLATGGDWTNPVLPGSSLRGVLRSHAERIARTLVTHQAIEKHSPQERKKRARHFRGHCPACDPLAQRRKPEEESTALESCDSLLRYEKVISENEEIVPEQLCPACRLFGSTRRGSRLIVEDAPYCGEELPVYKMLDFLAVDRFTGGGAEGFKFDALALWKPTFEARISLENPEDWELGWLTLVLRDLAEGWLRVGFGASKGFGKVTVTGGTLRQGRLDPARATSGQSSIFVVDEISFDNPALLEEQHLWVAAFNKHVSWERPEGMHLPADNYFGVVDDVYGGEAQ
ncbi:MAG: RAMP superfamily CRISPR-associated protein [Chloroflexota bacterium]|nr:RAMP superfamily CRISPR-associated protein [Chloroflexota bacterium]